MAKKAKSPTGKPSRVSAGRAQALKDFESGKRSAGKRAAAKPKAKPKGKGSLRAQKMDKGMPLSR